MDISNLDVFHYFEREYGPLASLSPIPQEEEVKYTHKDIYRNG